MARVSPHIAIALHSWQNRDMAIEVEVSLKIPRVKNPIKDSSGYPIDNSEVRFTKHIEVSAIPTTGAPLELATAHGFVFNAIVVRSDWHEGRKLFVIACTFPRRSIERDEY